MADIKLGPAGSETTLPTINWIGNSPPSLPVKIAKQISEKTMSDGSKRYGLHQKKKEWTLYWGALTLSQLNTIRDLYNLNQVLHFQNNWEDATWYDVVFLSFDYDPIVMTYAMGTTKYRCTIALKEV